MQAALSTRRAWWDGLSLASWGSLQLHIIDCCTMFQCTTCWCRTGMGNILDLPYWRQYVTSIYYVVTTITTTGYGGEPQPCACLSFHGQLPFKPHRTNLCTWACAFACCRAFRDEATLSCCLPLGLMQTLCLAAPWSRSSPWSSWPAAHCSLPSWWVGC